jgi:hypothetical protein
MKAGVPSGRRLLVDFDVLHARTAGTLSDAPLEPFERLCIAFGRDFHAAVGQVLNPAVQPLARGSFLGEEPEADALDAPVD